MLGRWFQNEMNERFAAIVEKIDQAVTKWAQGQIEDAERFTKLEGEIRAMKARMGKKE